MTKDEARAEVLRRWSFLPDDLRQSYDAADAFAAQVAEDLDFPCLTSKSQLIAAWVIREIYSQRPQVERAA